MSLKFVKNHLWQRATILLFPEKGYWKRSYSILIFSLLVAAIALACERDTKLVIEGSNPPVFVMSGSGILGSIRVRGPKKQREAEGEDASIYWWIKNERGEAKSVEAVGPIIYGKVPDGYVQVYPERGDAPPLVEGDRYNIRVSTSDANGADKFFIIRNGKIEVSDY